MLTLATTKVCSRYANREFPWAFSGLLARLSRESERLGTGEVGGGFDGGECSGKRERIGPLERAVSGRFRLPEDRRPRSPEVETDHREAVSRRSERGSRL